MLSKLLKIFEIFVVKNKNDDLKTFKEFLTEALYIHVTTERNTESFISEFVVNHIVSCYKNVTNENFDRFIEDVRKILTIYLESTYVITDNSIKIFYKNYRFTEYFDIISVDIFDIDRFLKQLTFIVKSDKP